MKRGMGIERDGYCLGGGFSYLGHDHEDNNPCDDANASAPSAIRNRRQPVLKGSIEGVHYGTIGPGKCSVPQAVTGGHDQSRARLFLSGGTGDFEKIQEILSDRLQAQSPVGYICSN